MTLSVTGEHAADLRFLPHQHPDRVLDFKLPYLDATVLDSVSSESQTKVALFVDIDPVALAKNRHVGSPLAASVNDRLYGCGTLFAVAIARVFGTALKGKCDSRPDVVNLDLPIRIELPAVPAGKGPDFVRALFEPLGWQVDGDVVPVDDQLSWGNANVVGLTLVGQLLAQALRHRVHEPVSAVLALESDPVDPRL